MTEEEFKNLDVGDVVTLKQHMLKGDFPLVIVGSDEGGMHKIAVQYVDLRVPRNYDLVYKKFK